MYIANGFAKTGTHFLCETLTQLGLQESLSPWRYKTFLDKDDSEPLKPKWSNKIEGPLEGNLYYNHKHLPYHMKDQMKGLPFITIFRNPRNVLVSHCRYFKSSKQPQKGVNIRNMLYYMNGGENKKNFVELYREYMPWFDDPDCLCVHFETLLNLCSLRKICKFIDIPIPEDLTKFQTKVFEDRSVHNPTFSGEWSKWKDVWTPTLEKEWIKLGGLELEDQLYYLINNKKEGIQWH
jgi:hypothetical protein